MVASDRQCTKSEKTASSILSVSWWTKVADIRGQPYVRGAEFERGAQKVMTREFLG